MSEDNSVQFGRIVRRSDESLVSILEPLWEALGIEFRLAEGTKYATASLDDGQTSFSLARIEDDDEPGYSHDFEIDVNVRRLDVSDDQTDIASEQRDAMERIRARRIYQLLVESGEYRAIIYRNGAVAASSHVEFDQNEFERPEKFNYMGQVLYPIRFKL